MNSNSLFEYSGTIKVSEYKGKELFSTRNYHNKGCSPLFRFFAKCLGGDFNAANILRPTKIKLFDIAGRTSKSFFPKDFKWNNEGNNVRTAVSADFIYLDALVQVDEDKATFRFSIPYSYLIGNWLSLVAIYSGTESLDSNPSAYYLLTKSIVDDGQTTEILDPINFEDKNSNYNLLIEWTMKISNPTTNEGE